MTHVEVLRIRLPIEHGCAGFSSLRSFENAHLWRTEETSAGCLCRLQTYLILTIIGFCESGQRERDFHRRADPQVLSTTYIWHNSHESTQGNRWPVSQLLSGRSSRISLWRYRRRTISVWWHLLLVYPHLRQLATGAVCWMYRYVRKDKRSHSAVTICLHSRKI